MEHVDPKNIAGAPSGSPDDAAESLRSFTSWKLDILNCIAIDPRLKDSDVRLAIILFRFMNAQTGQCNPAEGTLAELMKCTTKTVENCKNRLREHGWLKWKRTQRSSWYAFSDTNVSAMLDYMTSMDDARRERRLEAVTRNQVRISEDITRTNFRIETRNLVRIQTRNLVRTNTIRDHHKGTPDSMGLEKKDTTGGAYIPPAFDHLEAKDGSK
jgi:hypothetical protein